MRPCWLGLGPHRLNLLAWHSLLGRELRVAVPRAFPVPGVNYSSVRGLAQTLAACAHAPCARHNEQDRPDRSGAASQGASRARDRRASHLGPMQFDPLLNFRSLPSPPGRGLRVTVPRPRLIMLGIY